MPRSTDKPFCRKARRVSLFVLAVVVLRALVPAGFMLTPVPGGLAFTLCDFDVLAGVHTRRRRARRPSAQRGPCTAAGVRRPCGLLQR
ncbi:MAG: hypothetical protein ABSG30_10320 [Steroidobacteraceae bacterium]